MTSMTYPLKRLLAFGMAVLMPSFGLLAPPQDWCGSDILRVGITTMWIQYSAARIAADFLYIFLALAMRAAALIEAFRAQLLAIVAGDGSAFNTLPGAGLVGLLFGYLGPIYFVFAFVALSLYALTLFATIFVPIEVTSLKRLLLVSFLAAYLTGTGAELLRTYDGAREAVSQAVFDSAFQLGLATGAVGPITCSLTPGDPHFCTSLRLAMSYINATPADLDSWSVPPGFRNTFFVIPTDTPPVEIAPAEVLAWSCERTQYFEALMTNTQSGIATILTAYTFGGLAVVEELTKVAVSVATFIVFAGLAFVVAPAVFRAFARPLTAMGFAAFQLVLISMIVSGIMGVVVGLVVVSSANPVAFAAAGLIASILFWGLFRQVSVLAFETVKNTFTSVAGLASLFDVQPRAQAIAEAFGTTSQVRPLGDLAREQVESAKRTVVDPFVHAVERFADRQAGAMALGAGGAAVGGVAGALAGGPLFGLAGASVGGVVGAKVGETIGFTETRERAAGFAEGYRTTPAWAKAAVGQTAAVMGGVAGALDPKNASGAAERVFKAGVSGATSGAALGANIPVVGPLTGGLLGALAAAGAEAIGRGDDLATIQSIARQIQDAAIAIALAQQQFKAKQGTPPGPTTQGAPHAAPGATAATGQGVNAGAGPHANGTPTHAMTALGATAQGSAGSPSSSPHARPQADTEPWTVEVSEDDLTRAQAYDRDFGALVRSSYGALEGGERPSSGWEGASNSGYGGVVDEVISRAALQMGLPAAAMTAVLGLVSNGQLAMARNLVRTATSDTSLSDADIDEFIQRVEIFARWVERQKRATRE